ncbi:MAG: uroporphyrinogen-III synthase [Hyphomicrobium sp.]|uniref:uroporphyrinogen-III synthase n=1 Tax=Hyphomicrobium sp. TaxID=82 RepID=UPI003D0D318D
MHLLLTRPDPSPDSWPEPDALEAGLVGHGHTVTRAPLLTVQLAGAMPRLAGVQALIVTSRNALRAVAPIPEAALALPLLAVGPATSALARRLGFRTVIEGPGDGRGLADVIAASLAASGGDLVHLAGDTLAFDLASALAPLDFRVRTEQVYRTEPAPTLPAAAAEALRHGSLDGVVLMSPRTAKVYVRLVTEAGLAAATGKPLHFCLSEAVTAALAPLGTARTAVARAPNSQEMLALIAREAPDSA